jgi:hypothetical protein
VYIVILMEEVRASAFSTMLVADNASPGAKLLSDVRNDGGTTIP